ncbi:uncharacterized protein [Nicotiana tomentosiformis]|uniref:uncharacterized protein n=1 Tax=Nicotiana tomentosiformis TaxID=4098 RepID=UPI00388C5393
MELKRVEAIGDFNVVASVKEKIGGIPYQINKSIEFLNMIEDCGFTDLGFYGPSITYLSSSSSDHSPLLMDMNEYGHIFQKVKEFEDKVRTVKETWAQTNLESNRIKLEELNAQYIRHINIEESVLKQKTQLQWFKEGDANSRYFHNLITGRRRKLYIHKIKISKDEWVQGDESIGEAACDHFKNLFTEPGGAIRDSILSCIPTLVTLEDNDILTQDPTIQKIKDVVFSMNPTSAAGLDGLNEKPF